MAKKVTRKQLLKEPDEFITLTGRLIKFAREQRQALLIGGTSFLSLIIIISIVRFVSENNENKASFTLKNLIETYEEASVSDTSSAFSSIEEGFDQFLDNYGDKRAGKIGKVFYANLCYDAGSLDKAIRLYHEILDNLGEESAIKTLILNGLGYAYEQKEDYENASKYFEMIVSSPGDDFKDGALYNLGRIYKAAGDSEKSVEAYKQLMTDFPESAYVEIIKEKVSS